MTYDSSVKTTVSSFGKIHESIADKAGRLPFIETSDSPIDQHLENTQGGRVLSVSMFPCI